MFSLLKDEYMPCPQAEWEWEEISQQFEERWQLPNYFGSEDGKHIRIKCPRNSYSRYFNYKGYFSIVLMAFVGPRYEFLLVDAGCQGSGSD